MKKSLKFGYGHMHLLGVVCLPHRLLKIIVKRGSQEGLREDREEAEIPSREESGFLIYILLLKTIVYDLTQGVEFNLLSLYVV